MSALVQNVQLTPAIFLCKCHCPLQWRNMPALARNDSSVGAKYPHQQILQYTPAHPQLKMSAHTMALHQISELFIYSTLSTVRKRVAEGFVVRCSGMIVGLFWRIYLFLEPELCLLHVCIQYHKNRINIECTAYALADIFR